MPTEKERKELAKRFGQRIAQLRKQRGWTQEELGFAIQKDREAITRIEAGRVGVTLYTALLLARAFEITLPELMQFELD